MSRPKKATVDYFPHDCSHKTTIYILEKKFGNNGYAFWFKLLELLGSTEGHFFDCRNPGNWEFLQAKTNLDDNSCNEILNLLSKLKAIDSELWENNKVIWCQNFVDRIADVYKNRRAEVPKKPSFHRPKPQPIEVSTDENPADKDFEEVSTDENPQSKVKESKVNKTKLKESKVKERKGKEIPSQREKVEQKFVQSSEKEFFSLLPKECGNLLPKEWIPTKVCGRPSLREISTSLREIPISHGRYTNNKDPAAEILIKSYGRNPTLPEREFIENLICRFGDEKTLAIMKEAKLRNFRNFKTLEKALDENGNIREKETEYRNGVYSKYITENKLRRISEDIANDPDLKR